MAKLRGTAVAAGLSGSAGPVVFVQTANGTTVVREKPTPNDPQSPKQVAWRDLVRRAGALWRTLEPEQAEAWRLYAEAQREARRRQGSPAAINASGAFTALAIKVWQIDPSANPFLDPPAQEFTGDGIQVAATGGAGSVTFSASGPNADGVVTELLLQALPSRLATPQPGRDRHQGFATFASGSLGATVLARRGAYAASVRFVRAATGQASALVRVGVVVVS